MKHLTLSIVVALFYCSVSYSQVLTWSFNKIGYYNATTKKSVIDSITKGKISLVKSLNSFFITENGKMSYISFNYKDEVERDSDHFEYELGEYSLKQNPIFINITYRNSTNYGSFTYSVGKESKTFFITQVDSTLSPNQLYKFADTSLHNIHFEWVKVYAGNDGVVSFIHDSKLPDRNGVIKVWEIFYQKNYTYKGKLYKQVETKSLIRVDCKEHTMLVEEAHYYDTDQKQIWSYESDYEKWSAIIPGSVGEYISNGVCNLFNE